jgi:uncharacterized protein (DUF2267 family)
MNVSTDTSCFMFIIQKKSRVQINVQITNCKNAVFNVTPDPCHPLRINVPPESSEVSYDAS